MDSSLLEQGFTLMLVGMGTVFVFLTLLVGGMTALAAVVQRFSTATVGGDTQAVSEEEVAAIAAAIALHAGRHQ